MLLDTWTGWHYYHLTCPVLGLLGCLFFFSHYCFYFFCHSTTCCTRLPGLSCLATTTNLCQPSLSFMVPKRAPQSLPVLPPTCRFLIPRGVFFCLLFLPLLESRTVILSLCASLDSCELLLHPEHSPHTANAKPQGKLGSLTLRLALSLTLWNMSPILDLPGSPILAFFSVPFLFLDQGFREQDVLR